MIDRRRFASLAFAAALVLLAPPPAAADAAGWAALAADGTHALMRHARAPGTGDPPGMVLGDCATQRRLDAGGRDQARRIGERLRAAGIAVDRVLTSRWCRAEETADLLGVGAVEHEPALDSFFEDRSAAPAATAALRARLAALDGKAVLVTHQVNITALTGVVPASGEIVVVAVGAGGTVAVRGRIRID